MPLSACAHPRLFCYTVARPRGLEVDLLNLQWRRSLGVFGCDGFAVFSNTSNASTNWVSTSTIRGNMDVLISPRARHGNWDFGNALNAPLFIQIWQAMDIDHLRSRYDWVIKLDPDTVFLPSRMRNLITTSICRSVRDMDRLVLTVGDTPLRVHTQPCWITGPLEAMHISAMRLFQRSLRSCVKLFPPHDFGEDIWTLHCLCSTAVSEHVQLGPPLGGRLLIWPEVGLQPVAVPTEGFNRTASPLSAETVDHACSMRTPALHTASSKTIEGFLSGLHQLMDGDGCRPTARHGSRTAQASR